MSLFCESLDGTVTRVKPNRCSAQFLIVFMASLFFYTSDLANYQIPDNLCCDKQSIGGDPICKCPSSRQVGAYNPLRDLSSAAAPH